MSIKNMIGHIIKCSLDQISNLSLASIEDIIVEIPSKKENGDYSTNIALLLTKRLHKSPLDIAKEIINNLPQNDMIEEVKIDNPGFINFYLKKDFFLKQINVLSLI